MVKSKARRQLHKGPVHQVRQDRTEPIEIVTDKQKRNLHLFVCGILLLMGVYLSVRCWGLAPMAHPDSPYFISVARALLDFEVPRTFKRAPGLGLMEVPLSALVGGQHPDLTAGLLLNAVFFPFILLLLYLISREIIGEAAVWVAVICILNTQMMMRLTEAIAEIPLTFFCLLTIYLILRRSSWCYLFAAIATMVRYEGTALIVGAFVLDMIASANNKQRLRALLWAGLASVPLIVWLAGTALTWDPNASHYIGHYKGAKDRQWLRYLNLIWQVSTGPLLALGGEVKKSSMELLFKVSKLLTVVTFGAGVIYAALKRERRMLVLLIFLFLYLAVHFGRGSAKERYYGPIGWLVILVCCLGVQGIWRLINGKDRIPRPLVITLQVMVTLGAVIWSCTLLGTIDKLAQYSSKTAYIPHLVGGVALAVIIAHLLVYKTRYLGRNITSAAVFLLMIFSNQLTLAARMYSKSQHDIEFKLMVDWYVANAQEEEKLLTTLPAPLKILAPKQGAHFEHIAYKDSSSPAAFTRDCLKQNVIYVAWDSRIGLLPHNSYYKKWHMEKVKDLWEPHKSVLLTEADPQRKGKFRPVGYYEYLTTVGNTQGHYPRYINIFRLHDPAKLKRNTYDSANTKIVRSK